MAKNAVKRIDTKYFDSAIQELNSAMTTFNEALRNIKKQTERLQDAWDGDGAKKFDSAYKRLKQEFDDQSENLKAIRDDLQSILKTYQDWDSSAQSQIAGNAVAEE